MKTLTIYAAMIMLLIFGTNSLIAASILPEEEQITDTVKYNIYSGIIEDAQDNKTLPFATIECIGLNIATVSNIDGEFTLKIPKNQNTNQIKISYIGYNSKTEDLSNFTNTSNGIIIELEPRAVNLREVTIRSEDAGDLIGKILDRIGDNYSTENMMMQAFYRETIKKRRRYVAISEAVVDIFKTDYTNEFRNDQVKLLQGRKSENVEKMDTILFKVQGGPVTALLLDIMKNPYLLLTDDYEKIYDFTINGVISMNNRLHYVINFKQKPNITSALYFGKFYVDIEKLAITEAEFELNMENELEAASMLIRKKPIGLSAIPEKAIYRSKYTIGDNEKWYFSYARAEVKFDLKWDKKLFKTSYTLMSEIAITDRSNESVEKIPSRERFKRSEILDELVYVFFDEGFWGNYNVIEPDQSIETAIERLNRRYLRTEDDNTKP